MGKDILIALSIYQMKDFYILNQVKMTDFGQDELFIAFFFELKQLTWYT